MCDSWSASTDSTDHRQHPSTLGEGGYLRRGANAGGSANMRVGRAGG